MRSFECAPRQFASGGGVLLGQTMLHAQPGLWGMVNPPRSPLGDALHRLKWKQYSSRAFRVRNTDNRTFGSHDPH